MNFLQRLLGKETETPPPDPNAEVRMVAAQPTLTENLTAGFHIGRKTDVGQQREQNQDSLFTMEGFIEHDQGAEPFGIFIVADGMGGYHKGEIASQLATRTAADYLMKHIYLPYINHNSGNASQPPINEVLNEAVQQANNAVIEEAPEAGTTLTIAVVMGHHAYLAHVGDSRAYLYQDNQLSQITQDHSLVARLVELGQATPEEALTHPQRNVLYRALGQTGTLEVETYLQATPPNSHLLMCSDGMWGMVQDNEIARILASAETPEDGAKKLVDAANANGGDDNITVLLIGIGE